MNRRIIVICVVGLLAIIAASIWAIFFPPKLSEHRYQALVAKFDDQDPRTRLAAAETILNSRLDDLPARLAKVEALIDLGRFSDARQGVMPIIEASGPTNVRAIMLYTRTFVDEAAKVVADSSPTTADLTADRVKTLLGEAESVRLLLKSIPEAAMAASLIEARQFDIRAVMLRLELRRLNVELIKAQASDIQEQIQTVGLQVSDLKTRLSEVDVRIERLCRDALAADPAAVEPQQLLFEMYLRNDRITDARDMVEQIAARSSVPRIVASAVADQLLNLEIQHARAMTSADIDRVAKLIEHPGLTGRPALEYDLARARLRLAQGRPAEAETAARQILARYEGHPRAICILAFALIHQNRAPEALRILLPFNERVTLAEARYAAAAAYMVDGRIKEGRELLRQTLDTWPDLLPARIMLAKSLVDAGAVIEAEPDILTAAALGPDHPAVQSLQARMLVETGGIVALSHHFRDYAIDTATPAGSLRLAVAARLVLGDVAWLKQRLPEAQTQSPNDKLLLIADAWTRAAAPVRWRLAAALTVVLLDRVDADPLRRAVPAHVPALARHMAAKLSGTPRPSTDRAGVEPLSATYFIPWPEESALELVECGLDARPADVDLLDAGVMLSISLGRIVQAQSMLERRAAAAAMTPELQAALAYVEGDAARALQLLAAATSPEAGRLASWLRLHLAIAANDEAGVEQAIEQLVAADPWSEQPVLTALRDAIARNQPTLAMRRLRAARSLNESTSMLTQARLKMAMGTPQEAVQMTNLLESRGPLPVAMRLQVAEVRARALLRSGIMEEAGGVFAALTMSLPTHKATMHNCWADVLLEGGNPSGSLATLRVSLADEQTSPREMDATLTRCLALAEPQRLMDMIDTVLPYRPGDPVLLLGRAQVLWRMGQIDAALAQVDRVLTDRPQAPRAMMVKAQILQAGGRLQQAIDLYRSIEATGGRNALVAARQLEQIAANAGNSSTGGGSP